MVKEPLSKDRGALVASCVFASQNLASPREDHCRKVARTNSQAQRYYLSPAEPPSCRSYDDSRQSLKSSPLVCIRKGINEVSISINELVLAQINSKLAEKRLSG